MAQVTAEPATMVRAGQATLPAWPVATLLVGYPLWWALGFAAFAVLATAALMLALLAQRGPVELPPGFGIWAVFLLFAGASAVALNDPLRLIGFGVRYGNYVGATVVMVYVYNARTHLSRARTLRYLGLFFAFVGFGGWLGVVFPTGSLPTIAEKVLPHAVLSNSYVSVLVHPRFSELQHPYGSPISFARPSAPFPYTNSWGCNVALLVPLALALLMATRRERRYLPIALLAFAAVPAAETLNRGMFIAIGVALLYASVRYALLGHIKAFAAILFTAVVGVAAALATGVAASFSARLQYSQSNADRAEIYHEAWSGAVQSPILGHGAPKPSDVLDISIGTQGQIWTVMYSYGLVALAAFICFFGYCAIRSARPATWPDLWLHITTVIVFLTLFYYGYDGPQLVIALITAALVLRPRDAVGG